MSCGIAARHGDGQELVDDYGSLFRRMRSLRATALGLGARGGRTWSLLRVTPDGRRRSFRWEDLQVDEQRLAETLAGVPGSYDHLSLDAGWWGRVELGAPALGFFGAKGSVRSVSAQIRTMSPLVDETALSLRDHLRDAATSGVPQSGFVHVDSVADPYSEIVTSLSRLSDDDFGHEVHGYYWAVLLTSGHIERLGGLRRVTAEAPCADIEVVPTPNGDAVLCTLTASPLEMTPTSVYAWREFLRPVVRLGYPVGWEEVQAGQGYLSSPLWLFEGEPVVGMTRFVLDRGDTPDVDAPPVSAAETVEDPEAPTFWVYPGPGFVADAHEMLTIAEIRAWCRTAYAGRLAGVTASARSFTGTTWDTDDDGARALVVQMDISEPEAAARRLAVLLGVVDSVVRTGDGEPLYERIVVA